MRREEEIQRRAEKALRLAMEKRKQREEEKARLREAPVGARGVLGMGLGMGRIRLLTHVDD